MVCALGSRTRIERACCAADRHRTPEQAAFYVKRRTQTNKSASNLGGIYRRAAGRRNRLNSSVDREGHVSRKMTNELARDKSSLLLLSLHSASRVANLIIQAISEQLTGCSFSSLHK